MGDKTDSEAGAKKTRWPEHQHELVHTFGVDDYDAYWKNVPMLERMRLIHTRIHQLVPTLLKSPGKILELGPGPGQLFWALQEKGFQMYACDISQVVLDHLKAPPERVRQADLNKGLPDYKTKFNGIIGCMVLHHILKPEEFLGQLRDAIEPGGYVILTVPNIINLRNRLRMAAGKFPKLSASHRNFMTPHEVTGLMDRCGLKVRKVLAAKKKITHAISPVLFARELIVAAQVP